MRRPTEDQEVAGLTPAEVGNILSWRLINLSLPLIQEGQLSVSGERMCIILVNWVDWAVKAQHKQSLDKALLLITHSVCFCGEIKKKYVDTRSNLELCV